MISKSSLRALLFGALAACGDNSAPATPDGAIEETPLYAISATQFGPEGATSVLTLVPDPMAAGTLDLSTGIEIGGAAAIFGDDGANIFAVGGSDAPVLTRYQLAADGTLTSGVQMSLAGTGIASGFKRAGLVPFVSPTRAYWLDDVTMQVVTWNPQEMILTGSFSLEAAERTDLIFELGERAVRRDDLLFVGARYRTADDGEAGRAAVLVIDTTTDTIEMLDDARCGDTSHVVLAADGTIYAGTGTIGALMHALDRPAGYPAPCVLRIQPGQRTFDPTFVVSLPERVGDRSAGRLVAGPTGLFVLALHEELLDAPIGPDTEMFAPWEATAWRWWRLDVTSNAPATLVEGAPTTSGAGTVLHAGGRDYVLHLRIDDGITTLMRADETGALQPGLTVPGVPYGMLRVR